MTDPFGTLLAASHILILIATAIGWGAWIRYLVGGQLRFGLADHFLCTFAGWAACTLFLQNLVYCGVRIAWSAWLAVGISVAGCVRIFWLARQTEGSQRQRYILAPVITFTVIVLFQGLGLWKHGAGNYYGRGHQDHANYVQLAQFLIDKPFDTRIEDVELEPWMIKAIDTKNTRLAQSVANSYLAVVSQSDAKSAYGAVSIFSLGLMASAVWALLKNLGLGHWAAVLGGLWAGSLPIVTHTHLDGFFSQTFVLGLFPTLICTTLVAPRHPRLAWLIGTLLLGLLLNGYTEIFILGVAFWVAGYLTAPFDKLAPRVLGAACVPAAAVLCVPAYASRLVSFVKHQYLVASNPEALSNLAPKAGTWGGWSELFFWDGTSTSAPVPRVIVLAGFGVFALLLLGTQSQNAQRRSRLLCFTAIPGGVLALLLSLPVFSKYPFAKLLASFSPVLAAFAVVGLARCVPSALATFTHALSPSVLLVRRMSLYLVSLTTCCLICFSGSGTAHMLAEVVRNEGIISVLNSPESRAIYHQLETQPGSTYLLNEQHNILNAWLAYHARHSDVYADVDLLGDRPVPSTAFAFRRPPPHVEMKRLNRFGIKSAHAVESLPEILVRNPQGIEGDVNLTFYWIGDAATVEFHHFGNQPKNITFSFRALAGPAHPTTQRTITLTPTNESSPHTRSFDADAKLSFALTLKPGRNVYTLKVTDPVEWLVRLPGDARKHMVRIQELDIAPNAPR